MKRIQKATLKRARGHDRQAPEADGAVGRLLHDTTASRQRRRPAGGVVRSGSGLPPWKATWEREREWMIGGPSLGLLRLIINSNAMMFRRASGRIYRRPPVMRLQAATAARSTDESRREHRVPLSLKAIELSGLHREDGNSHVFIGARTPGGLGNMAMPDVLQQMQRNKVTVHGFRSTFRHPNHVVEQALAHTIGNAVEAAYRRGDLFEKRRQLMNDWAACARTAADSLSHSGE
jgi:hypothetical protein